MKTLKCLQHMKIVDGLGTHYFTCEKPAKWISHKKKPLCGIHRLVVDKFCKRAELPLCRPIRKETMP